MNLKQAYLAAFFYFSDCYFKTKDNTLGMLLSSMCFSVDPTDDCADIDNCSTPSGASWQDWMLAVRKITTKNELTMEEAYSTMLAFLYIKMKYDFAPMWIIKELEGKTHMSPEWLHYTTAIARHLNVQTLSSLMRDNMTIAQSYLSVFSYLQSLYVENNDSTLRRLLSLMSPASYPCSDYAVLDFPVTTPLFTWDTWTSEAAKITAEKKLSVRQAFDAMINYLYTMKNFKIAPGWLIKELEKKTYESLDWLHCTATIEMRFSGDIPMSRMIDNKIKSISTCELIEVREKAKNAGSHVVELQGKDIQSWDDYLDKMEIAFQFPNKWRVNIQGYIDWMKDLDWIKNDSFALIIHDYQEFLTQNVDTKKMVMEIFSEELLPWWQAEIEEFMSGANAKSFNIYLID